MFSIKQNQTTSQAFHLYHPNFVLNQLEN